jgi:hypothetical protein
MLGDDVNDALGKTRDRRRAFMESDNSMKIGKRKVRPPNRGKPSMEYEVLIPAERST